MEGGGGGGGGTDGVEGEGDQDESSSSSSHSGAQALEHFRREWKKELADTYQDKPLSFGQIKKETEPSVEYNVEDKAKTLFQMGVENEEKGNFYEAVQFYKRAFQLVPDIELRLAQQPAATLLDKDGEEEEEEVGEEEADNESYQEEPADEFDPTRTDLLTHLHAVMYRHSTGTFCTPQTPTTAKHISCLPTEVLLYLLRWVVGTELDLRSVEQLSSVCRGLYVCCRDQEIWRLACTRVWGVRCGGLGVYRNWREMYIFRSRVQTGGCYISKTSYIRPGENSFQDQYYRPWHLVQYYRYLRFFADGTVLMLTSPDEPVASVGKLRRRGLRLAQGVLAGHYRLREHNIVTIVISPDDQPGHHYNNKFLSSLRTFRIELEIVTLRNRVHCQLVWRRYSVSVRNSAGSETFSDFELIASRFPPLWFSRVKSYSQESNSPLV